MIQTGGNPWSVPERSRWSRRVEPAKLRAGGGYFGALRSYVPSV